MRLALGGRKDVGVLLVVKACRAGITWGEEASRVRSRGRARGPGHSESRSGGDPHSGQRRSSQGGRRPAERGPGGWREGARRRVGPCR